jgi:hypothetical protein
MAKSSICTILGCDKPQHGKGWCNAHYMRWKRKGDPNIGGPVITDDGKPLRFLQGVALKHDGPECLIWPFNRPNGTYGMIKIDDKPFLVHRYICTIVHGEPPTPKHQAAHSCGRGRQGCVSPGHLSWKTAKANNDDKYEHGTIFFGEAHPNSKLTEADVREIRSLAGRMLQKHIARKFGITRQAVRLIHRRINWAWLD